MDTQEAIIIFDALSQETRLKTFRLLVKAGPSGMAAGALSDILDVPHNTLSFHLNHLSNAGIITSERQGRSIIYAANFEAIQGIIGFMVEDCCSADIAHMRKDNASGNAIIELASCCPPQK